MIMIAIVILICVLITFSLFMLVLSQKYIYKVHYVRISPYRSEKHYTFIKAKNIADIQRQLEKKTRSVEYSYHFGGVDR